MIIPEREKGVKAIKVPRLVFRSIIILICVSTMVLGIFAYDYWKIIQQVFENKHLSIENRQLREQIQLFQMKINSLSKEIERIENFEKKLRVITGLEKIDTPSAKNAVPDQSSVIPQMKNPEQEKKKLNKLISLYEQKIASNFGIQNDYKVSKEINKLTKRTFKLATDFAKFDISYDGLKADMKQLEVKVHEIDSYLLDRKSFLNSTPTLMPTKGWVTSYFGPRISPISKKLGMHEGIDIGARPGTTIVAPADGIITFAGSKAGFGKFISIDHGYGIETAYAHAKIVKVKSGQRIKRGTVLALVGNTGYSTGPHLHYEVRINGTPVDPLYYILDHI